MKRNKVFFLIIVLGIQTLFSSFDPKDVDDEGRAVLSHALAGDLLAPTQRAQLEKLARQPIPLAQHLLAGVFLHEEGDEKTNLAASWYIISARNGVEDSRNFIEYLMKQTFKEFLKAPPQEQLDQLSTCLKGYKRNYEGLSREGEASSLSEVGLDLTIPQTRPCSRDMIASYIIVTEHNKCSRGEPNTEITNLRLNKLFFNSAGLHLAFFGRHITVGGEQFEGWPYGPVERALYEKYSSQRDLVIPKPTKRQFDPDLMDPIMKRFLDFIVEEYGQYSTWRLSEITHESGSPWHRVTQAGEIRGGREREGPLIPNDLIRTYFLQQRDKLDRLRHYLFSGPKNAGEASSKKAREK